MPNGRSDGKRSGGKQRTNQYAKETAYRENGIRHFLFCKNLFFLPRSSWFGSWLAPHPIAEIGAFVSVKENK